jgi:hypothetical protein
LVASVTVNDEFSSAASSWSGVNPGCPSSRTAAHAAVMGAAIEVPSRVTLPPPSLAEVMADPGAKRSVDGLLLLKPTAWSAVSNEAPTETAFSIQPGAVICVPELLLPAATTVITPDARNASMTAA